MERSSFEPEPRATSLLEVCDKEFAHAMAEKEGHELSTDQDDLGQTYEEVVYTTAYGDSEVNVRIVRPSLDTAEFNKLGEGTVDERPIADIWVHAPRSYLFKLENGEKYYADKGFFRILVLSDGSYLDIFSIAFRNTEGEDGEVITVPDSVGSMLRPIPQETDWIIQEIIESK